MSSGANYRDGRRDFRGGGYNNNSRGRGGGGRGGGFNKPRRYWDNDELYDKEQEGGGGGRRRRYSRSRSRSYSRSKSRSRTPERRQRNAEDHYEPKNTAGSERGVGSNEQYEPYIPQPASKPLQPQVTHDSNSWKGVGTEYPLQHPQANGGGRGLINPGSLPDGYASAENIQRIQQMHQQFQLHQKQQLDDPSLTFGGFGRGRPNPSNVYGDGDMTSGLQITKPEPLESSQQQQHHHSSSKKKKEKKKKKKSRRRSSSSSSSSSDDSSSESKKKKKSKRKDSDDSSDSSSGNDDEKSSDKKEKPGGLTKQQKEALLVQKDSYSKKLELLEREIDKLRTKEDELRNTGSRVDGKLIDDNLKLQAELKGRCKAVLIVLEKINDVLQVDKSGEEKRAPVPPPPPKLSQSSRVTQESQPQIKKEELSMFDFFDNGHHWCRLCNVFPETVEKMLDHFHSQAHQDQVEQLGIDDKPWHKRNPDKPSSAPPGAKKVPLKGMQFFSPVEGWYCRLCNEWMGDAHCATEHLKSGDHNSNYMNFLEEHPDWETKWSSDREKARIRAGLVADSPLNAVARKSRFEDARGQQAPAVFDETVGSIRVQMRNTHQKVDDPVYGLGGTQAGIKQESSGIDEWMGKTAGKVPVDIIDTQKFAEIVRQKHGAKLKEEEKRLAQIPPEGPSSVSSNRPPSAQNKDRGDLRDMLRREEGGRRQERVEMQISAKDNTREREIRDMRDRYRDNNRDRGGGGGGRRRTRSRSRSRDRERDRGYHGRRKSRSRSRSRSRDRDRRGDRDTGRRDRVEAVKKLPMIGKMPLYKRPLTAKDAGKDKSVEQEKDKESGGSKDSTKRGGLEGGVASHQGLSAEESNMSNPSDTNSLSAYASTGLGIGQSASTAAAHVSTFSGSLEAYGGMNLSGGVDSSVYVPVETPDNDLKPPGEKEAPGGTNLPDDLQQALDIIYKGGGKPITVPPPNMAGIPTGVPPPGLPPTNIPPPSAPAGYGDYASYMGYEPYQMSFEGYAPPPGYEDMEEVVTAPPGTVDHPPAPPTVPAAPTVPAPASDEKPPGEEEEDDMDDLRMLGIDVDDVAVVVRR